MKLKVLTIIFAIIAIVTANNAHAQYKRVNGYYKSNGTYVEPHLRSAPDGNPYNNYGSQMNGRY